jgi:multicomponent K+:H+ antiporter subunit E
VKLLPRPLLSAFLLLTWVALNNSLDPGQVALGLVIALALPPAIGRFLPEAPRLRAPAAALRLMACLAGDILVANLEVARRILGPESRLRPAFVKVPLDLEAPLGVAALAAIVTLTPGTLSADLDEQGDHLLVHALHLPDGEARLIALIKQRYEAPLREIFR